MNEPDVSNVAGRSSWKTAYVKNMDIAVGVSIRYSSFSSGDSEMP
jgi:hypothetical protein